MTQFKVGDVVRRVMSDHGGMQVGDIGTVIVIRNSQHVGLEEWGGESIGHYTAYLELVSTIPLLFGEEGVEVCGQQKSGVELFQ